jgi:hypothetical protein
MGAAARGAQQRWVVAAAVAIVLMGAFVSLVNIAPAPMPLPKSPAVMGGRPTVKIARPDETDALLKEEAELA